MKLQSLFFLSLIVCGATACFRVSSESAPVADLGARQLPTPTKVERSAEKTVALLELNSGGLLGGSRNGEWVRAKEAAADLKGGEQYKFYDLNTTATTEMRGAAPANDAPCEDFYSVAVDPTAKTDGGIAFGSSLTWNPFAHSPKKVNANSAVYSKIASEVLKSKKLTTAVPKITEIFQTDLDGDDQDEIVLSATSYKKNLSPKADVGDYSFVLLRKIINGKAENFVLAGDFVEKESNAGVPAEYKISSIADLNGDGKMEIVVYARYYEGDWVEVFELKNNQPVEVKELNVACGS